MQTLWDLPRYSNSSCIAIPLWEQHCLHMRANRWPGPSPTRYSTNLSTFERWSGRIGRGVGGPGGAPRNKTKHQAVIWSLWFSQVYCCVQINAQNNKMYVMVLNAILEGAVSWFGVKTMYRWFYLRNKMM